MDLREIGCEDGRWMVLAQDRVQCQTFVFTVLKLPVLLTEIFIREVRIAILQVPYYIGQSNMPFC